MNRRPTAATIAAVAVALMVGGLMAFTMTGRTSHRPGAVTGQFELTTHDGKRLSSRDVAGKPYLAVFGYTQCPDICPTTLQELGTLIAALGKDADRLRYLFFTVDPERDTTEVLKAYLSSFDPRIIGLTGPLQDVGAAARSHGAFFQKMASSGSYTMNHTSSVLLVDGYGRPVGAMSLQDRESEKVAKVRKLIQ